MDNEGQTHDAFMESMERSKIDHALFAESQERSNIDHEVFLQDIEESKALRILQTKAAELGIEYYEMKLGKKKSPDLTKYREAIEQTGVTVKSIVAFDDDNGRLFFNGENDEHMFAEFSLDDELVRVDLLSVFREEDMDRYLAKIGGTNG